MKTKYFLICGILFFLSMILFFNVDSAYADEKDINTELIIGGIVSALATIGLGVWARLKFKKEN